MLRTQTINRACRLDEFQARQAAETTTPQGAAKLFFDAVFVYMSGETTLGVQMLGGLMKNKSWDSSPLLSAIHDKPQILRSYVKGATPENDYIVNMECYELNLRDLSCQPLKQYPVGKVVRLMLQSGGASELRPLDFERNGLGQYQVRDFSGLLAVIRPGAGR